MAVNTLCNRRYEILPSDFERGRSGVPGLARDTRTGRLAFFKRTEPSLPQYEEQQRNSISEEMALRALAECGCVPALLDVCRDEITTISGETLEIRYLIMERVLEENRVLNNYRALPQIERAEILAQFFECLAASHARRIVNGDVDLKHLYWERDAGRLVVIDWGNARHEETQLEWYADDLARSAEIVYSLTALRPFPEDPDVSLSPLPSEAPDEFHRLCAWVPRRGRPSGAMPPTADELARAARAWWESQMREVDRRVDTWIPLWLEHPDGEGWAEMIHETLELDPRRALPNVARAAVAHAKGRRAAANREFLYRTRCEAGRWSEARRPVHDMLTEGRLPRPPGEALSRVLLYLGQSAPTVLDDAGWAALLDAFGELVDENDAGLTGSPMLGAALVEVAARQLLPLLPEDLNRLWLPGSLAARLQEVHGLARERRDSVAADTPRDPGVRRSQAQMLDRLDNLLIGLQPWVDGVADAWRDTTASAALESYKQLRNLLDKSRPDLEVLPLDDLEAAAGIVVAQCAALEAGLVALESQRRAEAAGHFLKVWLADRRCVVAFREWNSLSADLQPRFPGLDLPRRHPQRLLEALSDLQRQLVEAATATPRQVEAIVRSAPERLPPRWEVQPPVLEFLYLIDVYARTRRPVANEPPPGLTDRRPELEQSRWLLGQILRQPRPRPAAPSSPVPTDLAPSPPPIVASAVSSLPDSKTPPAPPTRRRGFWRWVLLTLAGGVSLLVLLALYFQVQREGFPLLPTRLAFASPTPAAETSYLASTSPPPTSIAARTITPTPSAAGTFTPSPSPSATLTPSPTLAPTHTLLPPTPVARVLISTLIPPFLSSDSSSPQQAPTVRLISLPACDSAPQPDRSRGLYNDNPNGPVTWHMQAHSRAVIGQCPNYSPLRANLGDLLTGDRLSQARALSLLGDMVELPEDSGEIGFFLIDGAGQLQEYTLLSSGGKAFLRVRENGGIVESWDISAILPPDKMISPYLFWLYVQFEGGQAQAFLAANNAEKSFDLPLDRLSFITARPVSPGFKELGLVAYGADTHIVINRLALYGP